MNNKQNTKVAHDSIAQKYYELYKDDKSDLLYFDEFLNDCKSKILDLGCGMGHYSNYINVKGFEVTGIDFSEEMIKLAKRDNSKIEYIVNDICDLNIIKGRKFDGIVLAYVLQHLSKKEVEQLFSNIKDYLELSAKLLIFLREGTSTVEEVEPIDTRFKYIINEYSKDEIKQILYKNNFEILKLEEKEYIDDPNSLSSHTLVIIAQNKN